jgi:hypothetical protein
MNDNNFKFNNTSTSVFVNNTIYNDLIEIKNIPQVQKNFTFNYVINYNYIINDNISITQDILDSLKHTIMLDGINYNLISIKWKTTKFLYDNKPVGLCLYLVHKQADSVYRLNIIIPLDLVEIPINYYNYNNYTSSANFEFFENINYKKMDNSFNVYTDTKLSDYANYDFSMESNYPKTKNNINNYINKYNLNLYYYTNNFLLNKLICSESIIPEYECCKPTFGKKIFCDLKNIENILKDDFNLNKGLYNILEDVNGHLYYITLPKQFDEIIGLSIINKIKLDENISFIKQ